MEGEALGENLENSENLGDLEDASININVNNDDDDDSKVEGQGQQGPTSTSGINNNVVNVNNSLARQEFDYDYHALESATAYVFGQRSERSVQEEEEDTFWYFFKRFFLMAVIAALYCLLAEIVEGVYRGPDLNHRHKRRRPIKWRRFP